MEEKREVLTPHVGIGHPRQDGVIMHDEVFGDLTDSGPRYRSVGWMGSAMLMLKTQIGLGVLSIPLAFDALGIIPGIICLLAIAIVVTWSNYMVGVFKRRHPEIYSISDVGRLIFGFWGNLILGVAFVLWWMFVAGSGMLGVSIALNALSDHATCTAVFVAAAAVATYILGSLQTLERVSWIAWVGVFCIVTSLLVTTIGVGVQGRPAAAPKGQPFVSDFKIVAGSGTTFSSAMNAVTTFIFAYAGTPAFFSIAAEMRDPAEYNKALIVCQAFVTAFYLTVGIVVYIFAGSFVSSPAPGTAGPTLKKVAYGFALPALMASTLLFIHITGKYIFVRVLRGSRHLASNTVTHWVVWLSCTFVVALAAYLIASGIPIFGDLVALVGAFFGTLMCFQPFAAMWLYEHWHEGKPHKSRRWTWMIIWCAFIMVAGTFLMIGGTYGAVRTLIADFKATGGTPAWSCANNA